MKTQKEIIKQVLLQFFPASIILLFGSRARNDFTKDSDFDLLIITNKELNTIEKRKYKAIIRKILAHQKIPADILIQSKKEIEIKKNITGHIVKIALNEGVKI